MGSLGMPTKLTAKLDEAGIQFALAEVHGCEPADVHLTAHETTVGPMEAVGPTVISAEIDTTLEAMNKVSRKRARDAKKADAGVAAYVGGEPIMMADVDAKALKTNMKLAQSIYDARRAALDEIIMDSRWDITLLGMQIMVEGLALSAFSMLRMMMGGEPLIQDITTRIMADESRHVAFGVLSLEDLYTKEMSGSELREREDFVIEASHLMLEARPKSRNFGVAVEPHFVYSLNRFLGGD